jgi:predicted alpha/beta-fold hydrolase
MTNLEYYYEIDQEFTIKIYKEFESVEHYYRSSSSCHDLYKLRVPTLFFNSLDDLLSPVDSIDLSICKFAL